jgi:membrane-associated protease RseP (regulator of RpoE activity)
VADLFTVHDVTLGIPEQPEAVRLRGYLQMPSHRAYPQIADRLRPLNYTAFLRRDKEHSLDELLAVPGTLPEVQTSRLLVHALLFGATILTTLYVGAGMSEARPADELWWPLFHLWEGWPFALSLLSILLAHELAHYFTSRRYRVPASLPYFIPLPIPDFLGNVLGTMGAVIVMKGRIGNRRAMLDIGAAGPLTGLIVAIPVLILGLSLSHVQPLPVNQAYSMEGNSLLYLLLKYAMFRQWLPSGGVDVFIHPVAFAGWAGLLVTSLNLIPAGQLDGGHVLYSLLGDRARRLTWPIILALAVLGLVAWPGWFLWAGLVFLFGQRHPGPLDSITQLDTKRKVVAVLVLAVFLLTFTPIPLKYIIPESGSGVAVNQVVMLAAMLAFLGGLRRYLGTMRNFNGSAGGE